MKELREISAPFLRGERCYIVLNQIVEEYFEIDYSCVDKLQKSINALSKKYEDTYANIENEIQESEASLCEMMSELTGSEADMAAIREFQKLLGGKF